MVDRAEIMKITDITVVVGSYNRASLLKNAIESLICQETDGRFSYELLVIDDGSTDDTSSRERCCGY